MLKRANGASFDSETSRNGSLERLQCPSPQDFTVSPQDCEKLARILSRNPANPYKSYSQFRLNVATLVENKSFPKSVVEMCAEIRESRAKNEKLHFLVRNFPVDKNVPDFNSEADRYPLSVKYAVKKTFIGESVLEMFSQLTGAPLLAYSTRNNGDFFQDVISERKYQGTQTQKTDGELYPHNDRTAHTVRPDILNLLAMRPTRGNMIPTTYFDGRDLLASLPNAVSDALQKPIFFTPFDDFSKAFNPEQQRSTPHPILTFADNNREAPMFRFYTGRTEALPGEQEHLATVALLKLERAIIGAQKYRVNLEEGDLLSIPNLRGLHARDIVSVVDSYARSQRWLLKTYAFWNDSYCERHAERFEIATRGRVLD